MSPYLRHPVRTPAQAAADMRERAARRQDPALAALAERLAALVAPAAVRR